MALTLDGVARRRDAGRDNRSDAYGSDLWLNAVVRGRAGRAERGDGPVGVHRPWDE